METEIEKRMREIAREEIAKEKEAAAATTDSELIEHYQKELSGIPSKFVSGTHDIPETPSA